MKPHDWKDIAELFGVAAIVASLIFVGLELRQSQQVALMEQTTLLHEMTSGFRSFVSDHPEVWRSGCLDEPLTDTEQLVFERLFEDYVSVVFTTFVRGNAGFYENAPAWVDNFALNLHLFPGLRKAWESQLSMEFGAGAPIAYNSAAVDLVKSRVDHFAETMPDLVAEPEQCGRL